MPSAKTGHPNVNQWTGLTPFPERSPFVDTNGVPQDWAQRWMQDLRNAVVALTPGPFADDAAAAIGRVDIGKQYYTNTGQVVVRLA